MTELLTLTKVSIFGGIQAPPFFNTLAVEVGLFAVGGPSFLQAQSKKITWKKRVNYESFTFHFNKSSQNKIYICNRNPETQCNSS